MRRRGSLWLVAVGLALGLAAAGGAGPPGTWTRISETAGVNTWEAGLARTPDGVLHVAWKRRNGNRDELWHTPIQPNGTVGQPTPIAENWSALNNPDLVVHPDGTLRIFFGGIRGAFTGDPNNSLNTAVAPSSGVGWTLQAGRVSSSTVVYPVPVGAALARDGTPVQAWGDSAPRVNGFHFGLSSGGMVHRLENSGCCTYDFEVAVDSVTGEVVVGWYSNVDDAYGIYTQTVGAGGPAGAKQYAPGSANQDRSRSLGLSHRLGLTGRIGAGGVYAAYGQGYPTYTHVALWRHGSAAPLFRIAAQRARHVNIAAAPEGRLWLMWERGGRLYFTRTNKAATRPGAIVSIRPPGGTTTIWRLKGEGSRALLDVLAHVSTQGSLASWHTQVRPGLQLSVTPGATTRFRVTEAGDPVSGATVRIGGRTLRTNAAGVASTKLKKGRFRATASKAGYVSATASFRRR